MKIDQLPIELIIQILGYQPTYRQIALVNKQFYNIVFELSNANISLRIDQRFFDRFFHAYGMDAQWLQSVQASNRQVSKLELVGTIISFFLSGEQRPIFRIVEKFAPYLTTLKLSDAHTGEFTMVEILMAIPNVERLEFLKVNLEEPNVIEHQLLCERLADGKLKLKQLKSLAIDSCGIELVRLFHRLPIGILVDLSISCEWMDLIALLTHQTNIKKLTLGHQFPITDFGTAVFDKLKLESLQINGKETNQNIVAAIVKKQTALKSLRFNVENSVRHQVMNSIADLSELNTLVMCANETSDESFVGIRKLTKLNNLTLRCGISHVEILAESDNTALRTLTLEAGMPADLVEELAKSVPHLKQFKIRGRVTTVDAVLRHFNFVEVLDIVVWNDEFVEQGDYFNPKLRELTITSIADGILSELWLTKLTSAYPNLKKLQMIGGFAKTMKIQPILFGFAKLESLALRPNYKVIVEDLDDLPNNKHNLKFVSLARLGEDALTDSRVKKFRDSFGIAKIRDGAVLDVAVDRNALYAR